MEVVIKKYKQIENVSYFLSKIEDLDAANYTVETTWQQITGK